jgi:hypothetical protein
MYLLSTMERGTGTLRESVYMLVLGAGVGLAMQVLTIVVQNTADYRDLGTATSGVTFFRALGSSFGTAIFGTLYTVGLAPGLNAALTATGVPSSAAGTPEALHLLPESQRSPIVDAYAGAIEHVFLWAMPVALLGLVISLFLREVPLRDSLQSGAADLGEGFAAPAAPGSDEQLERNVAWLLIKYGRYVIPQVLAASGSTLRPAEVWALGQVCRYADEIGQASLDRIADAHHVPSELLRPAFTGLAMTGRLRIDGDRILLRASGAAEVESLKAAWKRWLMDHLEDWKYADPQDQRLLEQALNRISARLSIEEPTPRATETAASQRS